MQPGTIYQHPLAYLLGLEGIALLRAFSGEYDREFTLARFRDVRALLEAPDALGAGSEATPVSTREGCTTTGRRSTTGPGTSCSSSRSRSCARSSPGCRSASRSTRPAAPGATPPTSPRSATRSSASTRRPGCSPSRARRSRTASSTRPTLDDLPLARRLGRSRGLRDRARPSAGHRAAVPRVRPRPAPRRAPRRLRPARPVRRHRPAAPEGRPERRGGLHPAYPRRASEYLAAALPLGFRVRALRGAEACRRRSSTTTA